jgi:thioredoxin reductase (NADPH)
MLPLLSEEQFDLLQRSGERCHVKAGDVLFAQGDRHVPMYLIVAGHVAISRRNAVASCLVVTQGPGSFTGEVGTLAGRAAVSTARTLTDCTLVRIDEARLRNLLVTHAGLGEVIMRTYIQRRTAALAGECSGAILLGCPDSPLTLQLREFLARNDQPSLYVDTGDEAVAWPLMARFGIAATDLPALVTADGRVLHRPSVRQLANAVGASPDRLHGRSYDVAVIGAGPAGLSAAVYAASEGLRVIVLDARAPGGQAGSSSRIENYFGFPTGLSGRTLAGRGLMQAGKFGAEVAVPVQVLRLDCDKPHDRYGLQLDSDERIEARALIIATGARYRKPALERLAHFEGRGVYYNASFIEASLCAGEEVAVVGGGNSAGQAAIFLAERVRHVHLIVRAAGLAASMSDYLIRRIASAPNITLYPHTEITALCGSSCLTGVEIRAPYAATTLALRHLFLFLGADPCTGWLNDCVALDDKGFVQTGPQLPAGPWTLERAPHHLETSLPGVFAVGDVRSGSIKRVAAAVGEGAAAVQALHAVLAGAVTASAA